MTKLAHYVAAILPLNVFESHIRNHFGTPACQMRLILPILSKIGAMATSLEELEKVQIDHIHSNTYQLVKKIVKIGLVDSEIIGLQLKKERNYGR